MKYVIKEIMPYQIRVEFEDGTIALVPITSNLTPEEIDDLVSNYDSDFFDHIDYAFNANISVNEERKSKKITPQNTLIENNNINSPQLVNNISSTEILFGTASPIETILLAWYFSERNNQVIKNKLFDNVVEFIDSTHFTLDGLVANITSYSNQNNNSMN